MAFYFIFLVFLRTRNFSSLSLVAFPSVFLPDALLSKEEKKTSGDDVCTAESFFFSYMRISRASRPPLKGAHFLNNIYREKRGGGGGRQK